MMTGRPPIWTPEKKQWAQEVICRALASGAKTMREACATAEGLPSRTTVFEWLYEDPDFADQYARARMARADVRADDIDEITQQTLEGTLDPAAARVVIEAKKWQAGKEKPKVYGDRHFVEADLRHSVPDESVEAQIAQLLGKAGAIGPAPGSGETE
jgi:hypothetical protein